jgi:type IV pilus assembly protein PilV
VLNVKGMTHNHRTIGRQQRGVGLIEVLIAVLILSFGMLGIASLQMSSLRNNQSALERGMVTVQTHSIVDAMHADRETAADHGFDIALDAAAPTGNTFPAVALRTWRTNLRNALGDDATGSVVCDGACTITIRWNDSRGSGADDEQRVEGVQTIVTQVRL